MNSVLLRRRDFLHVRMVDMCTTKLHSKQVVKNDSTVSIGRYLHRDEFICASIVE